MKEDCELHKGAFYVVSMKPKGNEIPMARIVKKIKSTAGCPLYLIFSSPDVNTVRSFSHIFSSLYRHFDGNGLCDSFSDSSY